MGRGELRGYDWAGLKLAIEVPPGVDPDRDWTLPTGFLPCEVDRESAVRIQVCDSAIPSLPEGTSYFHEGDVFEAGRLGSHHWIRRADDGRVALADADFGTVEIVLPMPASCAGFPLAQPLDDILLIHRALEQGAFALRGSAAIQEGSALVVLGDSGPAQADGRTAVWHGWLLLQLSADGVDVVPLPSTIRSGRTGRAGNRARLAGLHVLDSMTGPEDPVRILDADAGAAELLRFAFAPIACADIAEPMLWAATRIAECHPIVQLATAGQSPFAWESECDALCAALPAGA